MFDCPSSDGGFNDGVPSSNGKSDEEESEDASEVDRESEIENDDEVVYLGRKNVSAKNQSQGLLSH